MINFRLVSRAVGVMLIITGVLMWTGSPFAWYYGDDDMLSLFYAGLLTISAGGLLRIPRIKDNTSVRKREGYLIVALGWVAMVLCGMLPYLLSGVIDNVPDAIFETVSGMTTTGASILTDIEAQPQGILYWRSLTQWIGGMGIIVLTVAIFPLLGIGGVELFVAEAPGPTSDKIHPRIRETARRLWFIYVGLTVLLMLLFFVEGMTAYDAINHALTTMATGGFSTHNDSMASFSPLIQYTTCLFMFFAGTNYTIIYFSIKGKFKRVWASEEFKTYLWIVVVCTLLVTWAVRVATNMDWEQSFRDSLFQIVSMITTTGFVSADYTAWSGGLTFFFFLLLFSGACAGSTSGGIKLIRHLVFFKNSLLEFKRIIHPRAVVPLRLSGEIVAGRIVTHIIIFLLLYLFITVLGTLSLAAMGIDLLTALGAVATSVGNVGPAIGKVGPVDNFAWLPANAKLLLSFLMLLGRLELFTILVLFTPYFWRTN